MELTEKEKSALYTLIDANLNRAKEGLRVCEDVARFMDKSAALSKSLKKIRHMITQASEKTCAHYPVLLKNRDSAADVGRRIKIRSEFRRTSVSSLLAANFKRTQESLRVLEEASKLISPAASAIFKEARYTCYVSEKKMLTTERKKI